MSDASSEEPSGPLDRQALRLAEVERLQFSCDLHDGILQELIGARMAIETIRHQASGATSPFMADFQAIERRLQHAIREGRRWIGRLRGESEISDRPWSDLLPHLLSSVREEWPELLVISDVDPQALRTAFDRDTRYAILRIAHEALRNAARHSGCDRVMLSLSQEDADQPWCMEIIDEGKGFDPDSIPSEHYGILGMQMRAELLGAELRISTREPCGTRVFFRLEPKRLV